MELCWSFYRELFGAYINLFEILELLFIISLGAPFELLSKFLRAPWELHPSSVGALNYYKVLIQLL